MQKQLRASSASSSDASRETRVGPATVRAKSMAIITAVSVVDTVPSEAKTAITMSKNKNQFSLKTISLSAFVPRYARRRGKVTGATLGDGAASREGDSATLRIVADGGAH